MQAKAKEKHLREYVYDLLWMQVRTKYDNFSAPMPSKLNMPRKKDERSGKQIINDLLARLTA